MDTGVSYMMGIPGDVEDEAAGKNEVWRLAWADTGDEGRRCAFRPADDRDWPAPADGHR